MTRRRVLDVSCVLCGCLLTIVPGIRPAFAAPALFEELPVGGDSTRLAQMLRIDPVPDRARYMYEMTRLVLDNDPQHSAEMLASRLKAATAGGRRLVVNNRDTVSVPLSADWWSSHVFHRPVGRDELVTAILSDRQAALVCHGLTMLDDETLQYFADHGSMVSRLLEKLAAPAFGVFATSLHVRANRIDVPGGDDAAALWEAVLVEKVTRPERFIELLFETNEGRVAYLYDLIGQLDPPRRAFTLGLWMPNAAARLERFKLLATIGVNTFHEWHLKTLPFGRASFDLGMTLVRVDVDADGAPATRLSRGFWSRALTGRDAGADEDQPIDAVWLTDAIGSTDVRVRGDRLDQFAFGQRLTRAAAIATDADRADAMFTIRGFARYRMLPLALERAGVKRPSVYAAAIRQAVRLSGFDGRRAFLLQAQLQGALAIICRSVAVGVVRPPQAEGLIERLFAVPIADDGRYAGALAAWVRDDLLKAIPPSTDAEDAIIGAMAGSASGARRTITWEGQQYRLDLAASERQRLHRVREKQEALRIDVPLESSALARQLIANPSSAAAAVERLTALLEDVPDRLRENEIENVAPGVGVPPAHRDVFKKTIDDITKANRAKDTKRIVRAGEALVELSDDMLASSLLSFVYAADIGDPDGTVLLAEDVSRRHDFGLGIRDSDARQRTAWTTPRQDVIPNVPWHVTGSLLGLDIALAPLALRRISFDGVLEAPKLTSPERDAFALSVSLMNPYALTDRDRDAIADAISRGTVRVQLMTAASLDAVADQIGMEQPRRHALRWTLAHDARNVVGLFSLSELLVLGGGKPEEYAAWGMTAAAPYGCLCTALTTPARWNPLAGRPQLGLVASLVSDLNLHVAMMLKQMQLPAALARVVLAGAMQDFIDLVKPIDPGDWLTLARTARATTRERIEDYVSAATAGGPLMPLSATEQR